MRTVKTIRIFYLIYTIYTLFMLLVSDYKLSHAALGLFFVWLTYLFFHLGYSTVKNRNSAEPLIPVFRKEEKEDRFPLSSISSWPRWKYMLAAALSWISAILAARYYTGRSFGSVIRNLLGGGSAYNEYQQFFQQNNIASFSLAKAPYILMLAYLTIIMTWSVVGIILGVKRVSFWKKIYIVLVVGAYAYFGAARGTNFETYIIFILFAFCLLQKIRTILNPKNFKYLMIVFFAGIALIFIYRARIMNRGVEFINYICPEIHFNPNSFLAKNFPTIVNIGVSLFSYLGYGIYCIGVTVQDICFRTAENFFAFFIPSGYHLIGGNSLGLLLTRTVAMEARWIPDFVLLLDSTGLILYSVLFYFIGKFSKKVQTMNLSRQLIYIIEALIFIEMLSVPVGNFLLSSSSNKLMVLFALLWLLSQKIVIRIPVRKTSNSGGKI